MGWASAVDTFRGQAVLRLIDEGKRHSEKRDVCPSLALRRKHSVEKIPTQVFLRENILSTPKARDWTGMDQADLGLEGQLFWWPPRCPGLPSSYRFKTFVWPFMSQVFQSGVLIPWFNCANPA